MVLLKVIRLPFLCAAGKHCVQCQINAIALILLIQRLQRLANAPSKYCIGLCYRHLAPEHCM